MSWEGGKIFESPMAYPGCFLPALKAPTVTSPGQRPGFRNPWIVVRPERAQEPRPFGVCVRTSESLWDTASAVP